MNNVIMIIMMIILLIFLLIRFVIILMSLRRNSVRVPDNWGMDSISFFINIAGGTALGLLLSSGDTTESNFLLKGVLLGICGVLLIVPLLILPRKELNRMFKQGLTVDERIVSICARSARNALLITYLVLIVFIINDVGVIDRNALIILLASGLLVFQVSYFFYFYRKSLK